MTTTTVAQSEPEPEKMGVELKEFPDTISVILDNITGNSSKTEKSLDFIADGVLVNYSADSPALGSSEWKDIELERILQMRKLKVKNMTMAKDVNENVRLPPRIGGTILKKTSSNSNSNNINNNSGEGGIGGIGKSSSRQNSLTNVKWKEPIAEEKIMPAKILSSSSIVSSSTRVVRKDNGFVTATGTTAAATPVPVLKKGPLKQSPKVGSSPGPGQGPAGKNGRKKIGPKKKPDVASTPTTFENLLEKSKTRVMPSGFTSFYALAEINPNPSPNQHDPVKRSFQAFGTSPSSPSQSSPDQKVIEPSTMANETGAGSNETQRRIERIALSSSYTASSKKPRKNSSPGRPGDFRNHVTWNKKLEGDKDKVSNRKTYNAKIINASNIKAQEPNKSKTRTSILKPSVAVDGIKIVPNSPKKSEDPKPTPPAPPQTKPQPQPPSTSPPPLPAVIPPSTDENDKTKLLGTNIKRASFPASTGTTSPKSTCTASQTQTVTKTSSYFPQNTERSLFDELDDLEDKSKGLHQYAIKPKGNGGRYGIAPYSKKTNDFTSKLRIPDLDNLLQKIKPPKLPDVEVCNVLPGTSEWDSYWNDFNSKMTTYYSQVEKHSRRLDSLLVDEDGQSYKEELMKRHEEEKALKLFMGLPPKPPLIKEPLRESLEVGGYVIRPLGGYIPGCFLTTHDHLSFRLEVHVEKIESEKLENVNIDSKFNTMTITVPIPRHKEEEDEKSQRLPFDKKLIQINVPNHKKVENLEVGHPLYNGGKIVVTGK